jgi:hypothetical protein
MVGFYGQRLLELVSGSFLDNCGSGTMRQDRRQFARLRDPKAASLDELNL